MTESFGIIHHQNPSDQVSIQLRAPTQLVSEGFFLYWQLAFFWDAHTCSATRSIIARPNFETLKVRYHETSLMYNSIVSGLIKETREDVHDVFREYHLMIKIKQY
jgi:hypothetical protein